MPPSATELNCTAQEWSISAQEWSISADADIVGPGVLAAFLVSSALTVFAVFAGYLSGSLGDEYMTHFDRAIIKSARFYTRFAKHWMESIIRNPCIRPPLIGNLDQVEFQSRAEAWKHAVSRFILSLGDQQLVTGLAILISGIANQKTLKVWEFRVILSLAWFSTTSHLATLDALRTYHESKPVVRHIRVLGMTAVLALLLYMFSLNMLVMSKYPMGAEEQFVQCVFNPETLPLSFNIVAFYGWGIPLLIVISGYYMRVSELYWGHWIPPSAYNVLFERNAHLPLKDFVGMDVTGITQPRLQVKDILGARQASAISRKLRNVARTRLQISTDPSLEGLSARGVLKRGLLHATGSILWLSDSFFTSFSGIAFSLSFGIAQLVRVRWIDQPPLEEDVGTMGFGQIMAIFLLVLPPLAAVESYYDYAESRASRQHAPGTGFPAAQLGNSTLVPGTAPPRLLAEFMDMTDHEGIHGAYDRHRKGIGRYFSFDIALLDNLEANHDQNALTGKKKKMLVRYQEMREVEASIPLSGAMILMLSFFASNVLLGVALHLSETSYSSALFFTGMYSSTIILVGRGALSIWNSRAEIYSIFEEENTLVEENAAEGSNGGTAGEPGAAVELTELDTSRRTATGLVEEGRLPQGVEERP
ncbi:hypothetical protein B0T18DRAFT_159582 [Schizothecium vesticola]|uniref:Uncharacterized protein n=1 Tax=Schizothecium vesticola TaxID=314040 RepID=A0AA40EWR9_9PEZI|nr:hypothetical protein B0T18DRAFT_159582 [Schizothecium vesticola]